MFVKSGWLWYVCGKIESRSLVSVVFLKLVSATQRMVVPSSGPGRSAAPWTEHPM